VNVIFVPFTTVAGALTPPMATLAPAANPDPVTVTTVPPEAGPLAGLVAVIAGAGAGRYVNAAAAVTLRFCATFVITTSAGPAVPGGVTEVMVVEFTTTAGAAAPPIVKVASDAKLLPVIVTDVPPEVGPLAGLIPAKEGSVDGTGKMQEPTFSAMRWSSPSGINDPAPRPSTWLVWKTRDVMQRTPSWLQ
jgi:hypothetical protein